MTHGNWRAGLSGWLLAAPAVGAAVVFVWAPMLTSIGLSFFDWSLLHRQGSWRGLDHYLATLSNPEFHLAAGNTLIYLLALLPMQVGVPLLLAFLLLRLRRKRAAAAYRSSCSSRPCCPSRSPP